LKRTQDELCAHSEHDDDHDAELTLALKENEAVMSVLFPLSLPKKTPSHHLLSFIYIYYLLATLSARMHAHYCSASQEERVDMLNLALVEKGVITSSSHYGPAQNSASVAPQPQPPALPSEATMDEFHDDDEGGVVL
jgi:hypothetical protein